MTEGKYQEIQMAQREAERCGGCRLCCFLPGSCGYFFPGHWEGMGGLLSKMHRLFHYGIAGSRLGESSEFLESSR